MSTNYENRQRTNKYTTTHHVCYLWYKQDFHLFVHALDLAWTSRWIENKTTSSAIVLEEKILYTICIFGHILQIVFVICN